MVYLGIKKAVANEERVAGEKKSAEKTIGKYTRKILWGL